MALGELEGVLRERELAFQDELVNAAAVRFDAEDGRLVYGGERFRLQGQALDQIAARVRAPANYLRRCPPELLAENLNYWLERMEGELLVRFDGDEVRALLSDRYRPVSHLEVVHSLLQTCPAEVPAYRPTAPNGAGQGLSMPLFEAVWRTRGDSNPQPSVPKTDALSN